NSGSLVFLWETNVPKDSDLWHLSAADYREYQTRNQVFEQIGAMRFQSSDLTAGELPERIESAAVSPVVFDILGMQPGLGRSFSSDEDQLDKSRVVILSAGLWQRS